MIVVCFESISITHAAITDQAGLSHINTESFKQEEVQHELNQIITNGFDKEQALTELGAQVNITTEFDNKRRAIRSEFAKKAEDYRKQAEELPQGSQERTKLEAKAKQIDDNLRLFNGITSALYAPNSNGIIGDVARAAIPELAYQIGQYFKENKLKNEIDGGNRPEEQSANHLLAHAILGAAVSYATGNNPTTGALSGAGSEVAAPALANYLYGTNDPEALSQEQKDTIISILSLATVATNTVVNNGDINIDQMANDLNVSESAVAWNGFNKNKKEPESLRVKKERSWKVVDAAIKDTSVEVAAAAGLGVAGSITYVGDGKVNISGAVITGGLGINVNASKSMNTHGEKKDGFFTETCATAGAKLSGGGCFGSNGNNNGSYSYVKGGVGIGWNIGPQTGYSKTFKIIPIGNQESKK